MMDIDTKVFLRKKFTEYYTKNKIPAPIEIEKREFGTGTLTEKIKVRHKSFKSERELQDYLRREAPFYISYSIAYYEFPENQPMNTKNWLGADLVFDLDIAMDFLDSGKLKTVKNEAINLIDFLTSDFGFQKKDIEVNFSGSKGYHIHVANDAVRNLGGDERREIVDYVTGNLNFKEYLKIEVDTTRESYIPYVTGPKKTGGGWAGRIYNGLYDFIKNSTKEELEEIDGIGEKKAEEIIKNRDHILRELDVARYNYIPEILTIEDYSSKIYDSTQWQENLSTAKNLNWQESKGTSYPQRGYTKGDPNTPRFVIKNVKSLLVDKIINQKKIKTLGDVDKMVTIDTSRLIRLPDTIHGGSGLKAARIKDLEKFDPLVDAIALGNEKIKINLAEKTPSFEMNGQKFGPFSGIAEVPEYAGIYLLLRGFGDLLKN